MSKEKFVPQSKEVAKDTKMPAYSYQKGCPGTLTATYDKKSEGQKSVVGNGTWLQNLNLKAS